MTENKIINIARKYIGISYYKLLLLSSNKKNKETLTKTFNVIGELVALMFGTIVLCLFFLSIILSRQSLDVSIFKSVAEKTLSKTFNGRNSKIGKIRVKWIAPTNNLSIELDDIFVDDKNGQPIDSVSYLNVDFPLASLMSGSFIPKKIEIKGGSVTITRSENGNIELSLGASFPAKEFGPSWRIYSPEKKNKSEFMNVISNVQINNADVLVLDKKDKLQARLYESNFYFNYSEDNAELKISSKIENENTLTPLELNIQFVENFKKYTVHVNAYDMNPSFFAPKFGKFAFLNGLSTPIDLLVSLQVDRKLGLEKADINMTAKQGRVDLFKKKLNFDAINFKASLEAESEIMKVSELSIQSPKINFRGNGSFSELKSLTDGNSNTAPLFSFDLEDVLIDKFFEFKSALKLSSLSMSGRLDLDSRHLKLNKFDINFGSYKLLTDGEFKQGETGDWENISFRGKSKGSMDIKNLLDLWPHNLASGARRWVDRSMIKAAIKNVKFSLNLPQNFFLGSQSLNDDDFSLNFGVTNADIRYISTMTPYTGLSGEGLILGNSAKFQAKGGKIGDIIINSANANITQFFPKGADVIIDVDADGKTTDLIALVDEKPLNIAKKYRVSPNQFSGLGKINLKVKRPLLENFDRSRIDYSVLGKLNNVSAPFSIGKHRLKNGFVDIYIDKEKMNISGPVFIGPWKANLNLNETFRETKSPTRYVVEGEMNRDTLDGFGLGFRKNIKGKLYTKIEANGKGFNLSNAELNVDLKDSIITLGNNWSKDSGKNASITGNFKRLNNNDFIFENILMSAPGLSIKGSVKLADDFRLKNLSFENAKIDGLISANLKASPNRNNDRINMLIAGDYLNASTITTGIFNNNNNLGVDIPINLVANLKSISLSENYIINNASAIYNHNGFGVTDADFFGETQKGIFSVSINSEEKIKARQINLKVPDASEAARAFLGIDSIDGGRLQVSARMPMVGVEGPLRGVLEIEDFTLVKAPILAQILSVASLKGITDTLSGDGLNFNEFSIPFIYKDSELNIKDARVSGPALGMTGTGEVNFDTQKIDMDGVLVPAYTANSMLGEIPVIGDIFVGKKGEGIFALSYTVKGAFSNSQILVNPLSALTPGFLRGIFRTNRNKLSNKSWSEAEELSDNFE